MTPFHRISRSSARWYIFGIATALAAGWISRQSAPPFDRSENSPPEVASPPSAEAIEVVHTARARERDGDSSGARSAYLEAASMLPPIGDYLRLRAAQLTADSNSRSLLYRAVQSSPALDQVPVTEARVLERIGDFESAARVRRELGHYADMFRLLLADRADRNAQRKVLAELVNWISDSMASPQRGSVALAALPFVRELSAGDLLILARASSAPSPSRGAPEFFDRAQAGGARLTADDFAAWGSALYARGNYREAMARLGRVTGGPQLSRSLLLRGRAMLRSGQGGGKGILDDLVRRFPSDTTATPTALSVLGDLARDAGDYSTARQRWGQVAARFPSSAEAPRARFLVGLTLYSEGRRFEAANAWDSLFLGENGGEEALSAGYWSGRAHHESGDTATARARWRGVISRSRLSYYSRLSFRRLGLSDSTLASGVDQFPRFRALERARQRLELLTATGLMPELGLEMNWLVSQAGSDLETVVGIASLLRDQGRATYSARLGWRALEAGAADSRTYRLIFPLMFEAPLIHQSRAEDIDPALTAALIRQESLFDSMATSRAGARGLMQIMPAVGKELARSLRRPEWHVDSLYQPEMNLQFGTVHLAGALKRYGQLERTLAAYNAGGSRVTRWAGYPGSSDPELFVEWIPFPETRTYVRTVLRNLEFYRALYSWN